MWSLAGVVVQVFQVRHGRVIERIELDVWYVEHQSLKLDLSIMLRTVGTLFSRRGTYKGEAGGWQGGA